MLKLQLAAILILVASSCKKEAHVSPEENPNSLPADYRNAFLGKFQMTYTMNSSRSYGGVTKSYSGVTTVTCTTRFTVTKDSLHQSPLVMYTDSGIYLEGIPWVSYDDGSIYTTRIPSKVSPNGNAGKDGHFTFYFKGDSIFFYNHNHILFCYGKYYSCWTRGQGKWLSL